MMKPFTWDERKNEWLKSQRGVGFEDVVFCISRGAVLDVLDHPNEKKYRGQRIFFVAINDYAYLVPFVETDREIFLKTVIPSRKATKKYLGGQPDAKND